MWAPFFCLFVFFNMKSEIVSRNNLFLSIMSHIAFFIDHAEFLMALYVLKRIKLLCVFGLRLSFQEKIRHCSFWVFRVFVPLTSKDKGPLQKQRNLGFAECEITESQYLF